MNNKELEYEFKPHTNQLALSKEPDAVEMWELLTRSSSVIKAQTASYLGRTVLEALTPDLFTLDVFKCSDIKRQYSYKRMCGAMVRQIMEHHGYILDKTGVKIRPSNEMKPQIFSSASRYIKANLEG